MKFKIGEIGNGHPNSGIVLERDDQTGELWLGGYSVTKEQISPLSQYIVLYSQPVPPISNNVLPPTQTKSKKKTILIISIIVGVLLLCCGLTVGGIVLLGKNVTENIETSIEQTDSFYSNGKENLTKEEAYNLATGGKYKFVPICDLEYEVDDKSEELKSKPGWTIIARFFPESNKIQVYELSRDPDPDFTIIHEYGHAVFFNLLLYNTYYKIIPEQAIQLCNELYDMPSMTQEEYLKFLEEGNNFDMDSPYWKIQSLDGFDVVYEDFSKDPLYFGEYGSTNYFEWFAEAYAYYRSGKEVPTNTRIFFETLENKTPKEIENIDWTSVGFQEISF